MWKSVNINKHLNNLKKMYGEMTNVIIISCFVEYFTIKLYVKVYLGE